MRLVLLFLHILGGSVGLLAGTVAMAVRKGGRLHRSSGNVFTAGMLTLAASGLILAILKSQTSNIIGSMIAFYLITTAWLAGRRQGTNWQDWAAFFFGIGGAIAAISLGFHELHHPDIPNGGVPVGMRFFFGGVLSMASVGDLRMLARGLTGRPRILRHVWRMCFGLFIATGSFFLGQQQVFPRFLRGSVLLTVLALLPFPLMLYWLVRVRFGKDYRPRPLPGTVLPGPDPVPAAF